MIEFFKEARQLAYEIRQHIALNEKVPWEKVQRLHELMDLLAGYAVLGAGR